MIDMSLMSDKVKMVDEVVTLKIRGEVHDIQGFGIACD